MYRKLIQDFSFFYHYLFLLSQQWRLQQVGGRLPHLACGLREYSGKDIGRCVRLRAKAGKTTHIMYIGDSRIRQHIEVLLDHMRDLDFIITTYQVMPRP